MLCYPLEKATIDFDNNVLRFYNGFAADPVFIKKLYTGMSEIIEMRIFFQAIYSFCF